MRYVGKPQVAYSTTKAAIIQFTKTTAVIYAQRTRGRVRLNTVVPGLMATPLVDVIVKKYGGAGRDAEEYKRMRDKQVPTGKMGTGWDVAQAALFLCSEEAGYVTGGEGEEWWRVREGWWCGFGVGEFDVVATAAGAQEGESVVDDAGAGEGENRDDAVAGASAHTQAVDAAAAAAPDDPKAVDNVA